MEIIYLKSVDSTQKYLKNLIKENGYKKPTLIYTHNQTNGVGSRDNKWLNHKGNLFFSFVISQDMLPHDLKIESASIYFSYLLKDILVKMGSKVILKWPNDFYIGKNKIGGTITSLNNSLFYCGIGINLLKSNCYDGFLDVDIDIKNVLNLYKISVKNKPNWSIVFSKYMVEFSQNSEYDFTFEGKKIVFNDIKILSDGALEIHDKKVYSLR